MLGGGARRRRGPTGLSKDTLSPARRRSLRVATEARVMRPPPPRRRVEDPSAADAVTAR
jgi:hypothetical protein